MRCPRCNRALLLTDTPGSTAARACEPCRSLWIESDAAQPLPAAETETPTAHHCPLCQSETLIRIRFRQGLAPLDVERCPNCSGVWLEETSLAGWRRLTEPPPPPAPEPAPEQPLPFTIGVEERTRPSFRLAHLGLLIAALTLVYALRPARFRSPPPPSSGAPAARVRAPVRQRNLATEADQPAEREARNRNDTLDRNAETDTEDTASAAADQPNSRAGSVGDIGVQNAVGRSGMYYLPPDDKKSFSPVLVILHGSGGSGEDMVNMFRPYAERNGFAVLAPDSNEAAGALNTWEIGNQETPETDDLRHIMACVEAFNDLAGFRLDQDRVLIAGFSDGGAAAAYAASRNSYFQAFAVLHGGVVPGALGTNQIRGWFSTGREDSARPADQVQGDMALFPDQSNLEFHTFPGAHEVSVAEIQALLQWWLHG